MPKKKESKPMTKRRAIIYFAICIFFEQGGNAFLTSSKGFTVLWASIVCLAAYFVTFYCFGKALKVLNLGVSYAIWGGVSVIVVGLLTVTLLHGTLTRIDVIGMVIITLGVIGMDLWGVKEAPDEPANEEKQ